MELKEAYEEFIRISNEINELDFCDEIKVECLLDKVREFGMKSPEDGICLEKKINLIKSFY